jgi:hypothetical protein
VFVCVCVFVCVFVCVCVCVCVCVAVLWCVLEILEGCDCSVLFVVSVRLCGSGQLVWTAQGCDNIYVYSAFFQS